MADNTSHLELDERGTLLRLARAAVDAAPPTAAARSRMRVSDATALAIRWLVLYITWMVLLLGSLYAALLFGQKLAGAAAALASLPDTPGARAAGATLGFAAWVAVWLWHMMEVQSTGDCLTGPDIHEPALTWEEEDARA